jgi:hypothetical protein
LEMVLYITTGHRRWARKVARKKMFEDVAYEYAVVFSPRSTKIGAIQNDEGWTLLLEGGWQTAWLK